MWVYELPKNIKIWEKSKISIFFGSYFLIGCLVPHFLFPLIEDWLYPWTKCVYVGILVVNLGSSLRIIGHQFVEPFFGSYFRCNRIGHFLKDCPSIPKQNSSESQGHRKIDKGKEGENTPTPSTPHIRNSPPKSKKVASFSFEAPHFDKTPFSLISLSPMI